MFFLKCFRYILDSVRMFLDIKYFICRDSRKVSLTCMTQLFCLQQTDISCYKLTLIIIHLHNTNLYSKFIVLCH